MIGLLVLLFLILYLWLSKVVIRITARWAKDSGRNPTYWALIAGLGMFLLMFWDLIPTHVQHRYYCATEGGLTVYKTLEQWKDENPGISETLTLIKNPERITTGNTVRRVLNQRFARDTVTEMHPLHLRERNERIVDIKTGEILARYVNFDTDVRGVALTTSSRGIRDYKFWLSARRCEIGGMPQKIQFNGYQQSIQIQGEK